MTDSLRNRLITSDGFGDRLSVLRADRTLPIVAEWLRDHARELAISAADPSTDPDTRAWIQAQIHEVRALANSLAPQEPQP